MPPKESTANGRKRMSFVRRSRETEAAVEAMPALLAVVDPLNLVSSAMRSEEKAVSAVTSARQHVEVLVLAVATSMARHDSGGAQPGGGRQAGSRGKPMSRQQDGVLGSMKMQEGWEVQDGWHDDHG